jgi:hypothetical protein
MSTPTLRYQIGPNGFPVNGGALVIPRDTIVNTSQQAWAFLAEINPSIDCIPLDQQTYDWMLNGVVGYPYYAVRPGPGVVPVAPPIAPSAIVGPIVNYWGFPTPWVQ